MFQESFTLYKLIVLYMLELVSTPLTQAQICSFVLDKGYTDYLTLQQAFAELSENQLIATKKVYHRTQLTLTPEGRETIHYFNNRISNAIKSEIKTFLEENQLEIREEVSIQSFYDKSTSGEYEVCLTAKDKDCDLVSLRLSVPTEQMAQDVCTNWQKRNQEIYKKLTELLF